MCQLKIDDASNPDQKMQRLETIIAFEAISEEDKAIAAKAGIKCYSMEEVIFKGREAAKQSTPTFYDAKPDHCYVFSYTSGTTGDPKGVKISHQMMLGQQYACAARLNMSIGVVTEKDTYISYLPGAHSFE